MPTQNTRTRSLPDPVLLTRAQAAHALGISVDILDELRHSGMIACKQLRGRIMFSRTEIDRFAEDLPAWEPK